MKNVKILDCTLRDGGRIIECAFEDQTIRQIADKLMQAKIDIVEMGFLRDRRNIDYKGNSTFFTDVEQIVPFIPSRNNRAVYVAFVDFNLFDFDSLKPMDGRSVTGIRVGFTKQDYLSEYETLVYSMKSICEKGYQLYIQGVDSLNYTDRELLGIVDMVNEIRPASFGIVDTYGAMYVDDLTRIYNLIDHNMDKDIAIDFHSHNNFQLSFSLAQEVIKLSRGVRSIIIDATLNGMGKGAGNLNTELVTDFLERKMNYDYDLDIIFDTIDEYLYDLQQKYHWGYTPTSLMSGIYKSHPNNVIYLTQKFRLDTKDIKNILSMLDEQERQGYNYDKIDWLLQDYNNSKYDDRDEIEMLSRLLAHRPILLLVPGATLSTHSTEIKAYIAQRDPIIISVNFISNFQGSYGFFANKKRYVPSQINDNAPIIVTSDFALKRPNEIVINYHSLVNRGYKLFNNSVIMLLNLLKRLNVKEIAIAGMDGFLKESESNYFSHSFDVERLNTQLDTINDEITEMLENYVATVAGSCSISLITPSLFENTFSGVSSHKH